MEPISFPCELHHLLICLLQRMSVIFPDEPWDGNISMLFVKGLDVMSERSDRK